MKYSSQPFPEILALIFAVLCLFSSPATASDEAHKENILSELEKTYSQKSFQANFTQVSHLAALDIKEQASGKAYFSHPGKMKWQYLVPEHHEMITNGKSLWIFRPREKQVMLGDAREFFKSGAGGAFLSDISLVRKNFIISITESTPEYTQLHLAAKNKLPDIASILIRVSKKGNLIEHVTTRNEYDDTIVFKFSDIRFTPIDPGVYEFIPPEGVSIIEMN